MKQDAIKANLMSVHGCPQEDAEILAGQFMTLYLRKDQTLSNPHLFHEDNSPGLKDVAHSVNFKETIYNVEEQEVLREYIEGAYDTPEDYTYFMQNEKSFFDIISRRSRTSEK